MYRRAFTLIELLVVIAILVLVAALLFPVFAESRAKARRKECLSGEQQVGAALVVYAQDSDDSLPMAYYPPTFVGPPFSVFSWHRGAGKAELCWADLILPYAKDIRLFRCPDDNSGLLKSPPDGAEVPGELLSYALNYYFYRQPDGVERMTFSGGGLSEVANAANKILLTESASDSNRVLMRPDLWKSVDGSSMFERHQGGSHYVYADGHVAYQPMPQGWKDPSRSGWAKPETAQSYPAPQWFPWLETGVEKWK